jgi:predicted Zn-dependent protease
VEFIRRKHDTAISEIERAVALSPSDIWMLGVLGQVYIFAGQPRNGIDALTQAMRLSPCYLDWLPYNLALGCAWAGENESEAINMAEDISRDSQLIRTAIVQAFSGTKRVQPHR